jgi:hypothetical protein
MMPCKHAIPDGDHDHCCLMSVPCTGSYSGVIFGPDEQDCYEPLCLWETYQADQSYENCCRWLKHRAWMKLEGCE